MIFLITMPLWLGLLILLARLMANSAKPKPKLLERTITTPGGERRVFWVSADEPPSVTIAKMYPPETPIEKQDAVLVDRVLA